MRVGNRSAAISVAAWLWVVSVSAGGAELQLIEAIKDHDHETVLALLRQEIDVNAREGDGATALHWAVERNNVDTIDALLRAGADANAANDYGVMPISLACINRNPTVVKKLRRYTEIADITMLSCVMHGGGMTHETVLQSLTLFADEVMPAFR